MANETTHQKLTLENDSLRVVFDPRTAAITSLKCVKTRWRVQRRPDLAKSFRLVVPLPERLLHEVDGEMQGHPAIERRDNRSIAFRWEALDTPHAGRLPIDLMIEWSLDDEGLRCEIEIRNDSPHVVESCAYPAIGDLSRPEDSATLRRANYGYCNMGFTPLYPEFPNERGYWGVDYPIQMVPTPESPFVLNLAEGQGLYVGCHDTSAWERVEFTYQLKPGCDRMGRVPSSDEIGGQPVHIEFAPVHLPFVQPGETKRLSPIVLQSFEGDWQDGADIYKRWRAIWLKQPRTPDWLNAVHAWQQIQMTSWGDTLRIMYRDLPSYGEQCARNGVKAIQLVGWTLYGQDGRLPDHGIDPRLGTREELKEAIRAIEAMGVHIVLYGKPTCVDVSTDWYRDELHRYASRDIFGNAHGHEGWRYHTPAHLAGINTRPYAWMCMHSEGWREVMLKQVESMLELGASGILLDECQWHGSNAFYCFDKSHGHRTPAYNFAGDAGFEEKLRALIGGAESPLVLAGEGCYDLQNRHYTLTYHRSYFNHTPAMRYIDPRLPMMNWVYNFDDRESINICLLYRYIISYEPRNFKGRLSEMPLTLAYGRTVDALRERYRAFLWDGEFQGTRGASVACNGQAHGPYSVFRDADTGKLAAVIANHHAEAAAEIAFEWDDWRGSTVLVTPEDPAPAEVHGTVSVPARSAAVLMQV